MAAGLPAIQAAVALPDDPRPEATPGDPPGAQPAARRIRAWLLVVATGSALVALGGAGWVLGSGPRGEAYQVFGALTSVTGVLLSATAAGYLGEVFEEDQPDRMLRSRAGIVLLAVCGAVLLLFSTWFLPVSGLAVPVLSVLSGFAVSLGFLGLVLGPITLGWLLDGLAARAGRPLARGMVWAAWTSLGLGALAILLAVLGPLDARPVQGAAGVLLTVAPGGFFTAATLLVRSSVPWPTPGRMPGTPGLSDPRLLLRPEASKALRVIVTVAFALAVLLMAAAGYVWQAGLTG